jgi:hypothetical protein
MDRTQRLRTVGGGAVGSEHAGLGGAQPALVAVMTVAALIVALFAYLIMRAGPSIVSAVGPWVSSLPTQRSGYAWIGPAIAVSALLAGGSLAAMGLAAFVQGVRNDPFRWLAPVLIAFSSVVMTRLGLERSMGPLPATLFGALTALLLLGGGVLVQAQGLIVACAGAVLLALPLLGLVLDQAHTARGIENLLLVRDPNTLLALLVLSMTSVGVGLTAFVGRPNGSLARAAARSRDWDKHREQLGMALERARISELRLAKVEERARVMEEALHDRGSSAGSFDDEEAAFAAAARPQNAQRWFIALGMIVIGASIGAVALHWAMVRPLHAQVAGERGVATKELEKRAAEVAALRTELSGQSARLNELLAIEKERAAKVLAEATAAKEQLAALASAQAAAPAVEEAKAEAPKKRVSRATKRAASKRKAGASGGSDVSNGGLRESISDDPIGGLE